MYKMYNINQIKYKIDPIIYMIRKQ